MTEDKIKNLFSEKSDDSKSSVGLKNILERIKLVYGKRGELKIKSKVNEYTTVIITVYDDDMNAERSLT